jgi:HK97 family phage prohead protease
VRIIGHPIVFRSPSRDLGGFIETIDPRAVDRALKPGAEMLALRNHDSSMPLARRSMGTLAIAKDGTGLRVSIKADQSISYVSDLRRIIERGDAVGGSFAFSTVDDLWQLIDGTPHRTVLDMRVTEISVGVTFPAYEGTKLTIDDAKSDPKTSTSTSTQQAISSTERQQRIAAAFRK